MSNRSLLSALLFLVPLLGSAGSALALQEKDVSDGARVEAIVSTKDPTRIRVDGAQITVVFGNIYSSTCGPATPTATQGAPAAAPAVNPAGEVVLECDTDKGEVYVRPVPVFSGPPGKGSDPAAGKPISLFISTKYSTYTLLLHRSDVPAETIVLRDKGVQAAAMDRAEGGSTGRQAPHVMGLKAMLVAMTAPRLPNDVQMQSVNREVPLWVEARFVLERTYSRRGYVGERYRLTNVSGNDMVLAEQEFDREGDDVLAVSVENHNLRPGDSTAVYVIRRGS